MKKIFLLFTIIFTIFMTGCGRKEYNYDFIRTTKEKHVLAKGIVTGFYETETSKNIMQVPRLAKECCKYNETAAREYHEWMEVFYDEVEKETGKGYFNVDDFIDNYDGNYDNFGKYM